jgi:hypothetical protein
MVYFADLTSALLDALLFREPDSFPFQDKRGELTERALLDSFPFLGDVGDLTSLAGLALIAATPLCCTERDGSLLEGLVL